MPEALLFILLKGWLFVFSVMSLVYLIGRGLKNATVVDIYWGFGFIILSAFYISQGAIQKDIHSNLSPHLILSAVLFAGLRLGIHIAGRVIKEHPKEDPRYTSFREHFSDHPELATFIAYQLQGGLMVIASLPIFFVLFYQPQVNLIFTAGLLISFIGIIGEMIADRQLKHFIANPDNKGETCDIGLWYYSRHPNYFFEWTIWCGYSIMAIQTPNGWIGLISPILMLHFLINVTGIKATEERALKSRKGYKTYQKNTSAFIPMPKGQKQ